MDDTDFNCYMDTFKIKGASIRQVSDYIMLEAMTCSEGEKILRGWLEINGWKKEDKCFVDQNRTCSQCHISVPEGAEHLIKFCPICGAKFQTLTRIK